MQLTLSQKTADEAQYQADSAESRLAAVAELASLALPVGSPAEMKAESSPDADSRVTTPG